MQWMLKRQLKPINELIKKFSNTHRFCNNDLNKFVLLLRKGVYPYDYIAGRDFIKHHCLIKKLFTVNLI